MHPLRQLLLVAVLLFAQLAAGAHAVEHAAGNDDTLPAHACQLCLTAHDLGSALPSIAALPPVIAARLAPDAERPTGRSALPPPPATQRAPPLS